MRLNLGYYDYQYAVIKMPKLIKAIVGGFGSGKTGLLARRCIEYCYENTGIPGIILSPNLPMAKRSIIPAIQKLCRELGIPDGYSKAGHYFQIFGTKVDVISAHNPDNIKGPNAGIVLIDEPFLMHEAAFDFALSRVRDPDSTMREILLAGTPEQLNWGYDLLVSSPTNDVGYVKVSSRANPALPKEMLDAMERKYDKKMLAAYRDGEFVILGTKDAFYSFSDSNIRTMTYTSDLPLVLTCDFNRDPMCWNIMQEETAYGTHVYKVLDEIHVQGTNTYQCLDEFVSRWRPRHNGYIQVSGDYSGASPQDTVATISNFDAIIDRLNLEWGENRIHLEIAPNPLQATRLNMTNGALCNARGERRLYIDPSCTATIGDFRRAVIKSGTSQLDKNTYDPHHCDAIGYRIWTKEAV